MSRPATLQPDSPPASPLTQGGASEPRTDSGPVRRFLDPDYQPVAATLGDLRARIDSLDEQLIALIAERARCVRDATRFKRDAYQVAAPARQAQVFARARAIAVRHEQAFPGLPGVVEATWRTMVASFVACEGKMFDDTEALPHDTPSSDPAR